MNRRKVYHFANQPVVRVLNMTTATQCQLVFVILVSLGVAMSETQADEDSLFGLTQDQRAWVEQSCPRYLGPSLYFDCVQRNVGALRNPGIPNLSDLTQDQQTWIEQTCPRYLGPSLFIDCVQRNAGALRARGIPSLSALTPEQRKWIKETCPQYLGPYLYTDCVQRNATALGTSSIPQESPSHPKQTEKPSTLKQHATPESSVTKRQDSDTFSTDEAYGIASQAPAKSEFKTAFVWPKWTGKRPSVPSAVSARSLEPPELFRQVSKSVFVVVAAENIQDIKSRASVVVQGSAVAISKRSLITNCHVVRERPTVFIVRGESVGRAELSLSDPEGDRCFLNSLDLSLQPIAGVRSFSDLVVGERVYSVGAPEGLELTLGEGLISGLRSYEDLRLIQTSAPISSGSSGGGLFDSRGNLVGITSFLLQDSQNLNFAIAASEFWTEPDDWVPVDPADSKAWRRSD